MFLYVAIKNHCYSREGGCLKPRKPRSEPPRPPFGGHPSNGGELENQCYSKRVQFENV